MAVGGRRNPDELRREHWAALGREIGVGERVLVDLVAGVAERSIAALAGWTAEFRDRHGDQAILQTLPRRIRRQAGRLHRSARVG